MSLLEEVGGCHGYQDVSSIHPSPCVCAFLVAVVCEGVPMTVSNMQLVFALSVWCSLGGSA